MPASSQEARPSLPTRLTRSTRILAAAAVLAAGGAGVLACADSLHLDPGTGGKGSTTTTTHGSGGSAPTVCSSNPDCAYPTPVCDTVANVCVECLTFTDCDGPKPGTVCSQGACVCPSAGGEATLTYCAAASTAPAGSPGRCVDTQTSQTDCGDCGHACFGSCTAGKCADKWRPTATAGAPTARSRHVAVSTDPNSATAKMIIWGGRTSTGLTNTGGVYDPVTDQWTPTSLVNAPAAREDATAVWDDVENVLIVWGGNGNGGLLNNGSLYDPATNTWKALSIVGAPTARAQHTAVWAKTLSFMSATHGMIVWGGSDGTNALADGSLYDPVKDAWLGPIDAGPPARRQHTAVWADGTNTMFVWGGLGPDGLGGELYLGDGYSFDPSLTGKPTAWTAVSASGAPSPRARHTAVWDGTSMLIWGGYSGVAGYLFDGGRLNAQSAWTATGTTPAPSPREGHTAVWLDGVKQMVVFGGDQGGTILDTGWALDATLVWAALPTAPAARTHHTAVAAGPMAIMWGGEGVTGFLNSGAIYDASP